MPGIGSGNHGDAHRPTLPQRATTTLAAMTETTSALDIGANARTVETFLYALQDEDFDTAESTLGRQHRVAERRATPPSVVGTAS